jgi:hypothetical protein
VGEIEVSRAGPVRFELSVERPPLGGRLLGADSLAYPGPLAAIPLEPRASAPLRDSCGRYVDWFSGGAEGPDRRGGASAGHPARASSNSDRRPTTSTAAQGGTGCGPTPPTC